MTTGRSGIVVTVWSFSLGRILTQNETENKRFSSRGKGRSGHFLGIGRLSAGGLFIRRRVSSGGRVKLGGKP